MRNVVSWLKVKHLPLVSEFLSFLGIQEAFWFHGFQLLFRLDTNKLPAKAHVKLSTQTQLKWICLGGNYVRFLWAVGMLLSTLPLLTAGQSRICWVLRASKKSELWVGKTIYFLFLRWVMSIENCLGFLEVMESITINFHRKYHKMFWWLHYEMDTINWFDLLLQNQFLQWEAPSV